MQPAGNGPGRGRGTDGPGGTWPHTTGQAPRADRHGPGLPSARSRRIGIGGSRVGPSPARRLMGPMVIESMSANPFGPAGPAGRAAASMIGRMPCGEAGGMKGARDATRRPIGPAGVSGADAGEIRSRDASCRGAQRHSSSRPWISRTACRITPVRRGGTGWRCVLRSTPDRPLAGWCAPLSAGAGPAPATRCAGCRRGPGPRCPPGPIDTEAGHPAPAAERNRHGRARTGQSLSVPPRAASRPRPPPADCPPPWARQPDPPTPLPRDAPRGPRTRSPGARCVDCQQSECHLVCRHCPSPPATGTPHARRLPCPHSWTT